MTLLLTSASTLRPCHGTNNRACHVPIRELRNDGFHVTDMHMSVILDGKSLMKANCEQVLPETRKRYYADEKGIRPLYTVDNGEILIYMPTSVTTMMRNRGLIKDNNRVVRFEIVWEILVSNGKHEKKYLLTTQSRRKTAQHQQHKRHRLKKGKIYYILN